jgi:hypothetical protein
VQEGEVDSRLQDKIDDAMREAAEDAERRGLGIEDTLQFIADALINHADPDIVAFQERHNRQRLRHLY